MNRYAKLALFALPLLLCNCTKEEEPEINKEENIPGTWVVDRLTIMEKEAGSKWKYVEKSIITMGDWIGKEFNFTNSDYMIEFVESNNHIVKYESDFSIDGDTIHIQDLENFPSRNGHIEFQSTTRMVLTMDTLSEEGADQKYKYSFKKQATPHVEQAFTTMPLRQSHYYICSEKYDTYVSEIFIQSITSAGVLIVVNGKPEYNIQLTPSDPVLFLNDEGYFEKSLEESNNQEGKAILYYDHAQKALCSTHENSSVGHSVGKVLFWDKGE